MLFTIFFLCIFVFMNVPLMSGQAILGENCGKRDDYEIQVKMKELYLGVERLLQPINRRLAEAEQRIDRLGKLTINKISMLHLFLTVQYIHSPFIYSSAVNHWKRDT